MDPPRIVTVSKDKFLIIRKRPWIKWALLAVLILAIGGARFYFYHYSGGLMDDSGKPLDLGKLGRKDFKKASYLYANDGKTIIHRYFDEIRDPIKIKEVPDVVKKAFIAAEDQRFYSHGGVDWWAISRAQFFNFCHFFAPSYFPKSGASTLDIQAVRHMYANDVKDFGVRRQSYFRKIKEARVAIQLNKLYSKEEILEALFSLPYFGHGVNGIAEAIRRYCGPGIGDGIVAIRRAVILASLNKSPEIYCPIYHKPTAPQIENLSEEEAKKLLTIYEARLAKENARIISARRRWNWNLKRMLEEGFTTQEQYQTALFKDDEPLQPEEIKLYPLNEHEADYFARMVKEELLVSMGYEDEQITHFGGLRIKTCIDANIQKILNEEFVRHLAELNSEIEDKTNPINGSTMITDVRTGCIVALVGGYNYGESEYNRVMAAQSLGSLTKIAVYGAAFEAGKNFFDPVCNCPFRMRGAGGKPWIPGNFPEDHPVPFGYNPLAPGLIRSVNLQTLNLAREIGMDHVVDFTHRLGIWGNRGVVKDPSGKIVFRMPGIRDQGDMIVPLLPTAIGASDGNLIEWANGIATIVRGGNYLPPRLILEVQNLEGKILYSAPEPVPSRTIEEEAAQKLLILLRAVTKEGTTKISMRGIKQPVAAKTGTSNDPDETDGVDGPATVSLGSATSEFVMLMRLSHDRLKSIHVPRYMKRVSGRSDRVSAGWLLGFVSRRIWDRIYDQRPTNEPLSKLYLNRPKVDFSPAVEEGLTELLANYPDRYK